MKCFSVLVLKWFPNQAMPTILCSAFELSSFGYFQRGSIKEVAMFVSREVVSRSSIGERQSIQHKEYYCHCQVTTQKIGCTVITDAEYPGRVAFSLITKALEEFMKVYGTNVETFTKDANLQLDALDSLLLKFQNPVEADSVLKIQKDLDETKEVLVKSIDQLLLRGERLDVLAEKSQDLSFQSKAFLKQSEKLNSCCTVI